MTTQTKRILSLLKRKNGAMNTELNKIAFRYGARICDLRKSGHVILSLPVDTHQGMWRYILISKPRLGEAKQAK